MKRAAPVYGYVCLSCGQTWPHGSPVGKHIDPATGGKCRDVSGSAAQPATMSPVARRPWGPEGALAEIRYDAAYDGGGYTQPSADAQRLYVEHATAVFRAATQ